MHVNNKNKIAPTPILNSLVNKNFNALVHVSSFPILVLIEMSPTLSPMMV